MERVVLHSKYEQRQLPSHQRMGKPKMRCGLTATEGPTSVAKISAVPRFLLQLLKHQVKARALLDPASRCLSDSANWRLMHLA